MESHSVPGIHSASGSKQAVQGAFLCWLFIFIIYFFFQIQILPALEESEVSESTKIETQDEKQDGGSSRYGSRSMTHRDLFSSYQAGLVGADNSNLLVPSSERKIVDWNQGLLLETTLAP